jgi:predicted nucleotidyltransferase
VTKPFAFYPLPSMLPANCTVSMPEIYQRLNTTPQELAAFCEKWQIVELALFGSVLRDGFRATGDDPSDIDILYVLTESSGYSLFDVMEIRENLEHLFQRKVDLVSKNAIQRSRNWLRRREILESEVILYAKRSAIFN